MATIKIIAGMTGEYEIIRTNAPTELLEQQLKLNNTLEENGERINNPYDLLEQKSYEVEIVASSSDDLDIGELLIDYVLDYYDFI